MYKVILLKYVSLFHIKVIKICNIQMSILFQIVCDLLCIHCMNIDSVFYFRLLDYNKNAVSLSNN